MPPTDPHKGRASQHGGHSGDAHRLTEQLKRATRAQSARRPVAEEEPTAVRRRPFGWVVIVVIAALAIGGWVLVRQLQADSKLQDCVMSGRKNCAPIDTH
jgi:hypothetical protein